MTRFLFLGYFGFGNMGDEALLEATVRRLREKAPGAVVTVISAAPEQTRQLLDVDAVSRRLRHTVQAIRRCDVFVLGPGGIFQDVTSTRSVAYYAAMARLAQWYRKPVYFVGHGVGPLRMGLGRQITRWAAKCAEVITVRDSASLHTFAELHPSIVPELTADAALLLEPDLEAAQRMYPALFDEEGPLTIGISLRPWESPRDLAPYLSQVLSLVRERLLCRFLLLPIGGEGDRRLLIQLQRLLSTEDRMAPSPLRPGEALGLLMRLGGLIGMRLHSLVLGSLAGCPLAGIAYDPKVSAFLAELGLMPAVDVKKLPANPATAAGLICDCIQNADLAAQAARVRDLQVRAWRSIDVLASAAKCVSDQ